MKVFTCGYKNYELGIIFDAPQKNLRNNEPTAFFALEFYMKRLL
jgi:hypothetical protein